ncbi:ATP-dependent DNA helicase [Heracleum sosnowskyi]|uniref:ATP-dependent DNA helicase n=1 Tax=Heracleum sosnowskyi TaxID=360622 RepID=A0AAD8J3Q0_9APIA|nr:ATP-dependent DNA helicase [Heracleum sosnowskyi]
MNLISSAVATYRSRCISTKALNPKVKRPSRKKINWTNQQKQVLDCVSKGQSVFISGSAGTGKTVLLEQIIKQLKKIHGRSYVAVTGSTGVAACAIRGQTLHSFAGVGLGGGDYQSLVDNVVSNRDAYRRWNKVKALVIDEVSMIDAKFFDRLEFVARDVRGGFEMWGGIQLVVSGDFFQLPPVNSKCLDAEEYAFEAECWDRSFDVQFELTTVFRQSDAQLIKLLQGIRKGEVDQDDLQLLEKCSVGTEPDPSIARFFPRNDDVCKVNRNRLESLGKQIYVFRALDEGADKWKRQLKHVIAPDELEICIGARVMLTKNLDPQRKFVNGATGTVVGFKDNVPSLQEICKCHILPIVKFDSVPGDWIIEPEEWVVMNGEVAVAKRKQMPLMLAWALSIHKCQGMTLDRIHTDLSRAFGYGMVYVALSRVRSLDGLHISGFSPSKIKAHPKVLQFYERFKKDEDGSVRLKSKVTSKV